MKTKRIILALAALSGLVLLLNAWDDEQVIASGVSSVILKPNIMFLLDNSGSMNETIFHPDYDEFTTYSGTLERTGAPGTWWNFTTGYVLGVNRNFTAPYVTTFTRYVAGGTAYSTSDSGRIERTINLFALPWGPTPNNSKPQVRYSENYLKWFFLHASDQQRSEVNHFHRYGKWPWEANPLVTDINRIVRIRVASEAMKEVFVNYWAVYNSEIAQYGNSNVDPPRMGVSYFKANTSGDSHTADQGAVTETACHDNASLNTFVGSSGTLSESKFFGATNTPLAESLATVYTYFRYSEKMTTPKNFPIQYLYPFDHPSAYKLNMNFGQQAIQHWCQMNFVVLVTDGLPTQDSYLTQLPSGSFFNTSDNGIAPWGPPAADNDPDSLLDDVAYYMYNNDVFPDDELQGQLTQANFDRVVQQQQRVFTYVVGFNIDHPLLEKTARHGGGEYYTARDKDDLVEALYKIMGSIDEKVNAFAAFAAPKYSFTHGRRGYVATFIPRNYRSLWDGYLKCYLLDDDGNFPTDLENPYATVEVDGQQVVSLQWDAAQKLNARDAADREIFTAAGGVFLDFNQANITPEMLGLQAEPDPEILRDQVVDFTRGINTYQPPAKLGDIFHFNPIVVSAPLKWRSFFDESYNSFFNEYKDRREVVYAGTNAGMLHCFDVETGNEVWAFVPPSLLGKLKIPALNPEDGSKHEYFVDGKAMVRDIKVANFGDHRDWRTVLIFGLGTGGRAYYALDITDPDNPVFLWEFTHAYLGFTEARPVIADFASDGSSPFPGVVLAGGYNPTEVPANQAHADRYEGKGFFVVNAYTGALVKEFIYGPGVTNTQAGSVYTHTNPGFLYAFTAAPLLLDRNNDGLVDQMYFYESGHPTAAGQGGRIWRVSAMGAPGNWQPTKIYQAPDGQVMHLTGTSGYDEQYRLWLFTGTGRRAKPNDILNSTGQMIALMDNNISTTVTNADLVNITSIISDPPEEGEKEDFSLSGKQGFYFEFINKTGEIMFEPTPLFINSTLYFNTYAPVELRTINNPCTALGGQYVYQLKISASGAAVAVSAVVVEPGKILGYGALAGGKYKIYFGEGELGGSTIKDQETLTLENIFGNILWQENKRD